MNDELKQEALSLALKKFDKIYIHCAPHKNLHIGERGLLGNEKKGGIMLSFSGTSSKNMKINDDGVTAELRFAGIWEHIFIPYSSIDAILDDLQEPTFIFNFIVRQNEAAELDEVIELIKDPAPAVKEKPKKTAEILKIDFTKKKK